MSAKVSPLAPRHTPAPPPIAGVRIATAEAGIRYKNRRDVVLFLFEEGTEVAGVFTRSKCPSAPVEWCRSLLADGTPPRALVVNSGNANAFTGVKGRQATDLTAQLTGEAIGCDPRAVLLASTGVIGEPLDARKFEAVLASMAANANADDWLDAAHGIMTTDTFPKAASRKVRIGDAEVTLSGIAKGAGMIAPDMATMLSFVATDASIAAPVLQTLLGRAVDDSFNCTTVDGDTSTSDTLLLFATGKATGAPHIDSADDPRLRPFRRALNGLCADLAQLVARDGEGATRFITIDVTGAMNRKSARRIGLAIANSPLVKTAVAGGDANWGRVVMAVGKAGEPAERDKLGIWFGEHRVAVDGERDPDYSEERVSAYMKGQEIGIRVDLGLGQGKARIWSCDLTADYIAINADYRS